MLDLAFERGIEVMETNIKEGKENIIRQIGIEASGGVNMDVFRDAINSLQKLPKITKKRKRNIFLWVKLLSLSCFIFVYILYFWIYMILKGKVLLGGEKK